MDDNKVIRQLIRVNLELEGFEVVTAADGAECLDVVHQVRPDVVTLDVVMPRLGGLHTAARLRSDPRTWDIPIAIVSACSQGEVDNGESVGIDAFLAKPFEPTELVRTVGMLVREGRQQQREHPGDEGCGGCPEGAGAGGGAETEGAGGRGEAPRGDLAGTGGGVSEEAAPGDGVESGGSAGGEPGSGGGRAAG
ncbi:PleD family two-component system response regulator [Streptomyces sp. NPDC058000]|uniref:response regulator n=1 Tax=Streptomyces sp. NPDC058000 TaxID=3346299 RepID=UPI0036E74057